MSEHYFSAEPSAAPRLGEVSLDLPDLSLKLATDRGMFSPDRIDTGTKLLLLEGPPVSGGTHLVDLGAGYGPIALTLAHRNPQASVWAVEVNQRARDLCEANARRLGLANVTVIAPDAWPADTPIDQIWSNPPIRIGKPALHDLLETWLGRLADDGTAHLVVQKHLGADSLARWIRTQGFRVDRRGSRKAYRLLDVERADNSTDPRAGHSREGQNPERQAPEGQNPEQRNPAPSTATP